MKLKAVFHSKVLDFIKDLPKEARAKTYWTVELLQELGLGIISKTASGS